MSKCCIDCFHCIATRSRRARFYCKLKERKIISLYSDTDCDYFTKCNNRMGRISSKMVIPEPIVLQGGAPK